MQKYDIFINTNTVNYSRTLTMVSKGLSGEDFSQRYSV